MNARKFVFVVMILSAAFAGQSQGTFVFDQQSSDECNPGGGGVAIQTAEPIGQSFIPTLSSVGFIRLEMVDEHVGNGLGATVVVFLRQDSITGAIIGTSDPVSMPDGFGAGNNNIGYPNLYFSTAVTVSPGTSYYFQPVVQSGGDSWGVAAYDSFNYANGTEYYQGAAFNGHDLWFREGNVIPEPSTTALVLGSGLAIWFLRKRGKRDGTPNLGRCE